MGWSLHCVIVVVLIHVPSQNGMTVLMVASFCGHSSVVRVLLQAGADSSTTMQVR